MTAYPGPAAREQIVVPIKAAKTASLPRRSAERPRTTIPEVAVGAHLGFAESRRTGNIEITFPSAATRCPAADDPTRPSPALKSTPIALDARPRPHAAMPIAQRNFDRDLRQVDAEAPPTARAEAIARLMTSEGAAQPETCGKSAGGVSGVSSLCTGMDVTLARLVEAWPRLSSQARTAIVAALNSPAHSGDTTPAAPAADATRIDVAAPRRAQSNSSGISGRRRKRTKQ